MQFARTYRSVAPGASLAPGRPQVVCVCRRPLRFLMGRPRRHRVTHMRLTPVLSVYRSLWFCAVAWCGRVTRAENTLDRHDCMTLSCPLSRDARRASSHLGLTSAPLVLVLRPFFGSGLRAVARQLDRYYRQNPLLEAFECALEASSTMYLAPTISTRHTYSDSQSTSNCRPEVLHVVNLSIVMTVIVVKLLQSVQPTRSTGRYTKQPRGANHKFPPRSRDRARRVLIEPWGAR